MRSGVTGNGCKVVALSTGLGLESEFLLPASALECAHGFTWGTQMDNRKCYAKMFPLGTFKTFLEQHKASVQSLKMCILGTHFSLSVWKQESYLLMLVYSPTPTPTIASPTVLKFLESAPRTTFCKDDWFFFNGSHSNSSVFNGKSVFNDIYMSVSCFWPPPTKAWTSVFQSSSEGHWFTHTDFDQRPGLKV